MNLIMNFSYDPSEHTPLCEIMGRNNSDKGNITNDCHHNFTTFYYCLFKDFCHQKLRIFELGLGTNNINIKSNMGENGRPGASLYGWNEFFYNSLIFGADIDSDILFNTNKIKTYYCDQTKPESIQNLWNKPDLLENFDIIIENGLHEFDANVCFFENSIHKLKIHGYYIIEDIINKYEHLYLHKINDWKNKFNNCLFKLLKIPLSINNHDNTLLIVYKYKE